MMNLGQAIEELKQGKAVRRTKWKTKGMFIYLNKGSHILLYGTYQWANYTKWQKTGVVVGYWKRDPYYDPDIDEPEDEDEPIGWVLVNANPYEDKCQASHWMPLPDKPTTNELNK